MRRLIDIDTSRRRSPSTVNLATFSRMRSSSLSFRSLILRLGCTPAAARIACARARPMPKIAVNAISACWWFGTLIPAIRAMGGTCDYICFNNVLSTLALLMPRIGADNTHHSFAPHDLAFAADLLHRCHDFHSFLTWRGT